MEEAAKDTRARSAGRARDARVGVRSEARSRLLWIVLVMSLALHGGVWALSRGPWAEWRLVHYPLHTFIEVAGALVGLVVAYMTVVRWKFRDPPTYSDVIPAALVSMGILDVVHALFHAGDAFVWFHSLATLWGGLTFALVLAPPGWRRRLGSVRIHAALALAVAIMQVLVPSLVPTMVVEGRFTPAAAVLNLVGGGCMILAAVRMYRTYRETQRFGDLLFVLHCVLFGAAALMFEESILWDASWWGWHVLRFLAFLTAFVFAARSLLYVNTRLVEAETLDRMVSELNQANEELAQFAYRTSHDLKSPLTSARRLAGLIVKDLARGRTDEASANATKIVKKMTRLEGLVLDILELARADHTAVEKEQIEIRALFEDAREGVSGLLEDSACALTFHTDTEHVFTVKPRLLQVLVNLTSNGIKYRDPQKARPFVHVTAAREGRDAIRLSVEDNGLGIPEAHQTEVFEMFSRFHPEASFGSGLGMSIVKKHVNRLGGSLRLTSSPAGTRVDVLLPGALRANPKPESPRTSRKDAA